MLLQGYPTVTPGQTGLPVALVHCEPVVTASPTATLFSSLDPGLVRPDPTTEPTDHQTKQSWISPFYRRCPLQGHEGDPSLSPQTLSCSGNSQACQNRMVSPLPTGLGSSQPQVDQKPPPGQEKGKDFKMQNFLGHRIQEASIKGPQVNCNYTALTMWRTRS